jgi:flagellar hook-basal body complex protein FliE
VADAGLLQKASAKAVSGGFADTLSSAVAQVNKAQVNADRAVEQLQTGEAKNLHEVMITMEKADISLRLMVQMRNKVVDAYQEIMRMQV